MADEIKLKMPQVEQQVVINISGEAKIEKIVETLNWMVNKENVHRYWKEECILLEDLLILQEKYKKDKSKAYALEILKTRNALKAISENDISSIIPNYNKFKEITQEAKEMVEQKDYFPWAFEVISLKKAFSTFEILRAYGLDMESFFEYFN